MVADVIKKVDKRIITILIFIVYLGSPAYGQNNQADKTLNKTVTLPADKMRFDSLLHLISRQTGLQFSVNTKKFPPSELISVKKGKQSFAELITQIKKGRSLYYAEVGGHIIFVDRPPHNIRGSANAAVLTNTVQGVKSAQANVAPIKGKGVTLAKNNKTKGRAAQMSGTQITPTKTDKRKELMARSDEKRVATNKIVIAQGKTVITHGKTTIAHGKSTGNLHGPSIQIGGRTGVMAKNKTIDPVFAGRSLNREPGSQNSGSGNQNKEPGSRNKMSRNTRKKNKTNSDFTMAANNHHSVGGGHSNDSHLSGSHLRGDYRNEDDNLSKDNPDNEANLSNKANPGKNYHNNYYQDDYYLRDYQPLPTIFPVIPAALKLPSKFLKMTPRSQSVIPAAGSHSGRAGNKGNERPGFFSNSSFTVRAGFMADESLYFNPGLQAGLPFLYGIVMWSTNFKASGFRYGAGLSMRLSENLRLHVTFTTGNFSKSFRYYTLDSIGQQVIDSLGRKLMVQMQLHKIGMILEKPLADKWMLQFGPVVNIMSTKYSLNGTAFLPVPRLSEADLNDRFPFFKPLYTIKNTYSSASSQNTKLWVGLQLAVFYSIR